MTDLFVSYAQNYEDVYLWRALKHVEHGCYLDVGAYDPSNDSVTRAFYERGWRGINLEPVQAGFQKLREARPEDINLNVAAGSDGGNITLYEVTGTGMSTSIYTNALQIKENGVSFKATEVPVVTLDKVWRDLSLEIVHFMKIDVEGAEEAVLRGIDLSKYRPWIIVIESTLPNSPEENFASWEPILIRGDYHFATFDGLNRYYVAKEHQDLRTALAKPPNFFDHFIRASEFKAQQETGKLRQSKHALRERLRCMESERETLRREADGLHGRIKELQRANELQHGTLDMLQGRMEELQRANELLRGTLEGIYQSRFWRYTAPLRAVKHCFTPIEEALRGEGSSVARIPLRMLRKVGRWAAQLPFLRVPAKRLLSRRPDLRWRIWRFLLVTPETTVQSQFTGGPQSAWKKIRNTANNNRTQQDFKMFAMTEPREAIDVEALKAKIHRERMRHKAGKWR